jgi:hypothetical protein
MSNHRSPRPAPVLPSAPGRHRKPSLLERALSALGMLDECPDCAKDRCACWAVTR